MLGTRGLCISAWRLWPALSLVLSAIFLTISAATAQDLGVRDSVYCRSFPIPIDPSESLEVRIILWSDDTLSVVSLAFCYIGEDVALSSISPGPLITGLEGSIFTTSVRTAERGFTIDWVGLADRLIPNSERVIAVVYFKATGELFCKSPIVLDTCTLFPVSTCLLTPLNQAPFVPECDVPEYIMCMDAEESEVYPLTPGDFKVTQAFPNPFNLGVVVEISVARNCHLRIAVVDILGRIVRELTVGEVETGNHVFSWDGRNSVGSEAASGVYFLRVAGPGQTVVRKLVLLR